MGIRNILFNGVYNLYSFGILKNSIHVISNEDTIEALINSNKSIVRFGDGELALISGYDIPNQRASKELSDSLCRVLSSNNEDLLVALPDIFENMNQFVSSSQRFWKEHLFFHRRSYYKYCHNGTYYNAFMSRPYIIYTNKSTQGLLFRNAKRIWNSQNVVIIEGNISHNGVGNDLFDNVGSLKRIICPGNNAFSRYEEILSLCLNIPKDSLVLVSLGATGKPLIMDLFNAGYRVIDIGSLDMEYDWYLQGATSKIHVPKHDIVTYEDNVAAGYTQYLEQIIATLPPS